MEAVDDLSEAVDQVLYGRNKPKSGFGNALYELKEKRRKGSTYSEERATFYQDFVVIRQASQKGCLPLQYDEVIVPRYKIIGARIEKGVSFFTIMAAFGHFFLSIIFLAIGAGDDDGAGLIGGGVVILIFSLISFVLPLFMVRYNTDLHIQADPDDAGTPACGYTTLSLRTFLKV